MKKRMFGRFSESNKWRDLFNIKSIEVNLSLIFSILIFWFLYEINIYVDFERYNMLIASISINIAQALMSMIGIILAGLAIVIGLFRDNEIIKNIANKSSSDHYPILISFEFLAFIIAIFIPVHYLIYFAASSNKIYLPNYLFWIILAIVVYHLFFVVFYTVALIGNCIRTFYISNVVTEINYHEDNLFQKINEVRIDFLMRDYIKNNSKKQDEFIHELLIFVENTSLEDKENIKNYIKSYYGNK